MKIRTRVKIAGAVAFCVILAYGAWSIHSSRVMTQMTLEVKEADQILNRIFMLRALTYDYLSSPTERAQKQWQALYGELLKLLDEVEYRELLKKYGIEDTADKVRSVGEIFSRLLTIEGPTGQAGAEEEIRREFYNRLTTQLLLAAQDLMTRTSKMTEEINEQLAASQRTESTFDMLALLIFGFLIISTGVFLQRAVVKPVLKLHKGAEIVGAGHLNHQVGIDSPDEIGDLSRAFDRMTANLRQITVSRDELVKEMEERTRAEQALRESEERFRTVFENAVTGIAITDWEGRFLQSNPAYCALLEYTEEELRRFEFASLIHPEDREANLAQVRRLQAGELPFFQIENRYIRKDGQLVWVHKFVSILPDAAGKPTYLMALVTDVTERKQAEEQVMHLASFPQINPSPVLELDLSGALTYHNPAAFKVLEKLGPGAEWRTLLPGDLDDIIMAAREKKEQFFYREVKIDNAVFAQNIFFAEAFNVLRIYTMDITRRKQAEEELTKALAELEASNKELEAFSYSISHDLKAPLRAIHGFAKILLQEHTDHLDAEGRRLLRVVSQNALRMSDLIDDLLSYSRAGLQKLELRPVNLASMVKWRVEELQAQEPRWNLQLIIKDPPLAYGDLVLLEQVVANLVDNALKFTKDQETPIIEVGGWTENNENIYYVKDNGVGFDMNYADKLFVVFQRLHSGPDFGGTGVGLAIVRRIVARHGGRVWAKGKVGEGATFYFSLPRKS